MSEREILQAIRRRFWTDEEWSDVSRFEGEDFRGGTKWTEVPDRAVWSHGTDLPGSWHQQSNRGERHWCAVHGEIG